MTLSQKITRLPLIWQTRKILLFTRYFFAALCKYKKISLFRDTVKYFPCWWRSVKRNNNPLEYDQPWIVYGAIAFLNNILNSDMTVWEFGSGSSTLYFARRVKQVFSIENNPEWFSYLTTVVDTQKVSNVNRQLIENQQTASEQYFSKSEKTYFQDYAQSINALNSKSLDLVLIDGRARTACIMHAMEKIKQGGWLIVDNSERNYYFDGNDDLFDTSKWEAMHFVGPTPYTFSFSRTSFFKKKYE
jgi:precorrin-6B methylase 2